MKVRQGKRTPIAQKLTLTVPETARLCGIGERTMWQLVSRHEVPVARVGTRVLIPRSALEAWLNSRITVVA